MEPPLLAGFSFSQRRVRTTVTHVGPAEGGARTVTIAEANKGQRVECTYDQADGMLIGVVNAQPYLFTETALHLRSKE